MDLPAGIRGPHGKWENWNDKDEEFNQPKVVFRPQNGSISLSLAGEKTRTFLLSLIWAIVIEEEDLVGPIE